MSSEWQRLSPVAVIYFAVRGLMHLLNTYAVVIAAVIAASQFGFSAQQIAVYVVLAVVLLLLGSLLYYLNFAYIQEPGRFLIRHGIFSKNRTELPFGKIQNVSVKQPFYYRPFNLVVLSMDSAGSSSREVALAALSREKAELIQGTIAQFNERQEEGAAQAQTACEGGVADAPEPSLLLTRSTFDVVLHGLAHNRAWFLLAVATPLLAQMDRPLQQMVEALGLDASDFLAHASMLVLAGLALLCVLGFVFLMSLLSVAGAVLALADLKLYYDRGTYKRTSGLLNRYETQVKKSRVQTLRYQQSWLDLVAKRLNMVLEPFAVATVAENQNMMQKILLPSISHSQFCDLARHLYADFDFNSVNFSGVSRLYLLRAMVFLVLPATLAAAVLAAHSDSWRFLTPVVVAITLAGAMILRWRRLGVGTGGRYVVVRRGFIGREYFCFAAHKAQQVKIRQSLFLQRRGLATLEIVLASRTLTVPLIDQAHALRIAEQCLRASELSKRSWM